MLLSPRPINFNSCDLTLRVEAPGQRVASVLLFDVVLLPLQFLSVLFNPPPKARQKLIRVF
jgi:hypothetical protein